MNNLQKKFLDKSSRYMRIIQKCPFVRMAAVCNNTAIGDLTEQSDIDLFIVVKEDRLFVSRLIVTFVLHVLGVRRHGTKVAGRFCLSFFIDDSDLNLEKIALEQDYYLMYWCKSMVPFIDRGVLDDFEKANKWIPELKIRSDYLLFDKKPGLEWLLRGRFGDFLEGMLADWQMKRALRKMYRLPRPHGVIVTRHMLKFHDVDKRAELREEMKTYLGL